LIYPQETKPVFLSTKIRMISDKEVDELQPILLILIAA
jgi:hypothetical protein